MDMETNMDTSPNKKTGRFKGKFLFIKTISRQDMFWLQWQIDPGQQVLEQSSEYVSTKKRAKFKWSDI
jgi:hypothetical protein